MTCFADQKLFKYLLRKISKNKIVDIDTYETCLVQNKSEYIKFFKQVVLTRIHVPTLKLSLKFESSDKRYIFVQSG